MKRTGKSLLSIFLTLLLLAPSLCCVPAPTAKASGITVVAAGNCGVPDEEGRLTDTVTYTVTSDGVMTVRGAGDMAETGPEWRETCAGLVTTLVVTEGVTSVGDCGFKDFMLLTSVSLPASVTRIGKSAFKNCSQLCAVTLPENLRSVGEEAFSGCGELLTLSFPDSVSSMGADVCRGCERLYTAILPAGITEIPARTFYGCKRLVRVTVPYGVTSVGDGAFFGCDALEDVWYLSPIGRWGSVSVSGQTYQDGLTVTPGNRALESAVIHAHYPGGGTSGYVDRNEVSTPTCGAPAGYDRVEICAYCCTELGSTWVQTAPATGAHTPGAAVRENEAAPTCTRAGSYDEVVRCTVCTEVISRTNVTVPALDHRNAVTAEETAATATAHGYTAGVYCPDCETWLSGHAVIHNTLGERTGAGENGVRIRCTVCGEDVLYETQPAQPGNENEGPFSGAIRAIRNFLDWVRSLLSRLGLLRG